MKNVKNIAAAAVLASLSFGAFAAESVSAQQATKYQEFGVIPVSGAHDLSSLQDQLAEKADKAGAKAFSITNTTGSDLLRGTAIIYK